jgi:hypothetical protein
MKKKRVLMSLIIMVLLFGIVTVSCASRPLTRFPFMGEPVQVISRINADSSKTGELTNQVWLSFLGTRSFPSIAETAKSANITKIATVEYYTALGFLGLYTNYTTIVTGE